MTVTSFLVTGFFLVTEHLCVTSFGTQNKMRKEKFYVTRDHGVFSYSSVRMLALAEQLHVRSFSCSVMCTTTLQIFYLLFIFSSFSIRLFFISFFIKK